MKKSNKAASVIFLAVCMIVCVFLGVANTGVKAEAELRTAISFDFEDGSVSGWGSNGNCDHEIVADGYSGKALKSTLKEGETQNRIQRYFAVGAKETMQENYTYTFSFRAKAERASGIEGYFYVYDDKGGVTTAKFSAPADEPAKLTSEWKNYTFSISFRIEEGAVKGNRVFTDGFSADYSGTANGAESVTELAVVPFCDASVWYLDDYVVKTDAPLPPREKDPVPEGKHLVFEDGFETEDHSAWTSNGNCDHTLTSDCYIGSYALKSSLKQGESQNRIQREFKVGEYETIAENAGYEISFYAKAKATVGLNAIMYFYDQDDVNIGSTLFLSFDSDTFLSSAWAKYEMFLMAGISDGNLNFTWKRTDMSSTASGSWEVPESSKALGSVVLILYTGSDEWVMDEFRMISEREKAEKPSDVVYGYGVLENDFADGTYDPWKANGNTNAVVTGDETKTLLLTPADGTGDVRIQTNVAYGEETGLLIPAFTQYVDVSVKGSGKLYVYAQVNFSGGSKDITLVSGETLTDGFVVYSSDISAVVIGDRLELVWHRPDWGAAITATETVYEGCALTSVDFIIIAEGGAEISLIRVRQSMTVSPATAELIGALDGIGEITKDSKAELDGYKAVYDALPDEEKPKVFNLGKLYDAYRKLKLFDIVEDGRIESIAPDFSSVRYTGDVLLPVVEGLTLRIFGAEGEELLPVLPGTYAIYEIEYYLSGESVGRRRYETPAEFVVGKLDNDATVPVSALAIDPNSETYMAGDAYEVAEDEAFTRILPNSGYVTQYKNVGLYIREKATQISNASAATKVGLEAYTVTLPSGEESEGYTVVAVRPETLVLKNGYYKFRVELNEGYTGEMIVKVNGEILENEKGVYGVSVTEDIVVTAEGATRMIFTVTTEVAEGVTVTPVGEGFLVPYGGSFGFTVTIGEGYGVSESGLTVKIGDDILTEKDGVYTVESVKGEITIAVTGVEKTETPSSETESGESVGNGTTGGCLSSLGGTEIFGVLFFAAAAVTVRKKKKG